MAGFNLDPPPLRPLKLRLNTQPPESPRLPPPPAAAAPVAAPPRRWAGSGRAVGVDGDSDDDDDAASDIRRALVASLRTDACERAARVVRAPGGASARAPSLALPAALPAAAAVDTVDLTGDDD